MHNDMDATKIEMSAKSLQEYDKWGRRIEIEKNDNDDAATLLPSPIHLTQRFKTVVTRNPQTFVAENVE